MSDPITRLGLNCPKGGTFYVCQESRARFVGCCASDPCADASGICPSKDLRYSSYQANRHDDIPKEACSGSSASDGGLWYTCKFASPPFMGCCTSNPCNGGCPAENLRGAVLGTAQSEYGAFTTAKTATAAATASSSTAASSTPASVSTSSLVVMGTVFGGAPGPTSSTQPQSSGGGGGGGGGGGSVTLSGGAIAGICVGIAVVICALVGIMIYMCRKRARERREARNTLDMPVSARSEPWSPYLDSLSPTMWGQPEPKASSPLYTPPVTPGYGAPPGPDALQPHQPYYPAAPPPMSHVESSWMPLRDSGSSQQSPHRGHLSTDSRDLHRGGLPGYLQPVAETRTSAGPSMAPHPYSGPPGGMIAELPGSKEHR